MTKLFHITHMKNLRDIIRCGALLSVSELRCRQVRFATVAHESIQDQRSVTSVPCGPGGNLHDYIPFYFAPRSPMLCAIYHGRVASCQNQANVVHLVSTVAKVDNNGLRFAFTDGHAIMAFSQFYDDPAYLTEVDWQVMRAKYWSDTLTDMDRKRRRQAEFLVHRLMPWSLISQIVVMKRSVEQIVHTILEQEGDATAVLTKPVWYY